ncbi:DUF58 domain-containing protein [Ornithinibacillus halotolerans]|uniref:DUF58 domain-containing protein n=1 Tax=Ornithinibacillus halotolerans TaxID=1274357 RepID=UPI00166E3CC9|nr:DUF58 domain-containing protein [Ornithinibacillus halotolerans]
MPTRKLIVIFACFSFVMMVLTVIGVSWLQIFLLNGLIFSASLIDLLFIPKRSEITLQRQMPSQLERGLPYLATILVNNQSKLPCQVTLMDGLPQSFQARFPLMSQVEAEEGVRISYELCAPVRGDYKLDKLYARYSSKFGLWEKQTAVHDSFNVRVLPDLSETKNYLEDAQKYLMHEGVKVRKRKTGVGEFAQIRSYVVGDDPRKINWRQTAKLQTVMTNEFEPEHGKHVMLLIDCGRMMGAELKHGNRLEKAIEAALTVAAAALNNGDYVGVIAFSKQVSVFLPPEKGITHLHKIVDAVYNLQVDPSESNYLAALQYVQAAQKKRSLMLLFSDTKTFLQENRTLAYFEGIKKRHLLLLVTVEDELLRSRARQEPIDIKKAVIKGVAQQEIIHKKKQRIKWEKQGFLLVEAKEDRLATAAVSHYIQVINQGLL